MGQDPEQLRAEIAQTRGELDQDLNVLAEKVSPSKVVERRVEATKGALVGVKDKVMGVAGSATDSGSDALSSVGSAAGNAPTAVKDKAAGNPLAAGVIAFGVGWLVSSLMPASKAEARAAGQVKQAVAEPVKAQLATAAREVKEEIAPAAQESLATVKETATEAAGTVKEQAADAAGTVKDQAADSAGTVRDQARESKDQAPGTASGDDEGSTYDDAVARLGGPLVDPLPPPPPPARY